MAKQTSQAIVIGGSIAGLLAARALSDYFRTVSVIERDRMPEGAGPRPGAPQAAHEHVLLLRGLRIVESLFPGIGRELATLGAPTFDMAADVAWLTRAGWGVRFASDLKMLSCTRDLLEWVIRRRLLVRPGIRFIQATDVCGLVRDRDAIAGIRMRERGLQSPDREERAGLVVDASGRHSKVPEWIAAVGYQAPAERIVNGFLGYASRMYRIPDAGPDGWLGAYVQAAPPEHSRGAVILPVEGNRWHLTLAGVGGDYPPTDEPGFLSFAASLRSRIVYEAIRDAEPLTPIAGFRATENRWRSYETVKSWPQGLIVLGDAACAFNPVYAQGMTTAAIAAETLSTLLSRQPQVDGAVDLTGFSRRYQRALARENGAAWRLATGEDLRVPQTTGARSTVLTRLVHAYLDRIVQAATERPDVRLAFLRTMHMLDGPGSLFAPQVLRAVVAGSSSSSEATPQTIAASPR